jgi:holliday junction DNA helicase RuvA
LFAYINGVLKYRGNDYLVVDVSGIGYRINTSLNTLNQTGSLEETIKVYTYMYVREDQISIYGFSTKEELSIFEKLISVSGVGPKAALALLSAISPSKFSLAVITNDAKTLTKAQGIGGKTAQRIILELKDKLKKDTIDFMNATDVDLKQSQNAVISEAVNALIVLGYAVLESNETVAGVYQEGKSVEDIIKECLKKMM